MNEYLKISLSVDALEWTSHWLGNRRCDLISVAVARSSDLSPRIRIIAVESKARSESEPFELSLDSEPFKEGSDQVVATLDALRDILCPDSAADVVSDLKQSAFLEHLLSEVLSRIYPVPQQAAMSEAAVIRHLTQLSRRELVCDSDLELSGLVVVTQQQASVPTIHKELAVPGEAREWSVRLIRCGVPQLRELFEELGLEHVARATLGVPEAPAAEMVEPRVVHVSAQTLPAPTGDTIVADDAGSEVRITSEGHAELADTFAEPLSQDVRDLVTQLDTALELRQFPTERIDQALVVVGPTLVSVPVVLKAGHSSKAIESVTRDIARELGVRNVAVENDERAYHIRFLVPRRDRTFPQIPRQAAIPFDREYGHYLGLLLGVAVNGQSFRSFISEWPHLLVAGTTGSGKTTFLRSLLLELAELGESHFEVVIVDGKAEYDYIGVMPSKFFSPKFPDVLLGHENAPNVVRWLVEEEIPARREALKAYFMKNPEAPRQPRDALIRAWSNQEAFPVKPIVVFIDEFAEIMQAAGALARDFETLIQRAVQTGRSALVHLLLATQRPDASVIAGAIKANLPSRVALALPSHHDSMTILNSPGAEDLVGSGDMLFLSSSGGLNRLQAFRPFTK